MRRSTRPEPVSAPSSKTSITEAACIQRSATNPRLSSKPNSAKPKLSERTQPKLCHSNPVSQPKGAVQSIPVNRLNREIDFPCSVFTFHTSKSAQLNEIPGFVQSLAERRERFFRL